MILAVEKKIKKMRKTFIGKRKKEKKERKERNINILRGPIDRERSELKNGKIFLPVGNIFRSHSSTMEKSKRKYKGH